MLPAKSVTPSLVNEYFGATEGRQCEILRTYFRNGEHHHSLRDVVTGETFASPAIFWSESATATLPADLNTPCLIDHVTFIGRRQIKRVDSVELGVDTDPRVRQSLNVGDLSRPLARLKGDTVDIDGNPVGAIRGWQTYVYADEPLDVI